MKTFALGAPVETPGLTNPGRFVGTLQSPSIWTNGAGSTNYQVVMRSSDPECRSPTNANNAIKKEG